MGSKSCPACGTHWPATIAYERCPECDVKTSGSTVAPILKGEAESRARRAQFNRDYADREIDRIHRGELQAVDVGASEAFQVEREIAKLEESCGEDVAA